MFRSIVGSERRSWEEDEEEVNDREGGNESLRRLSGVGLTLQPKGSSVRDRNKLHLASLNW